MLLDVKKPPGNETNVYSWRITRSGGFSAHCNVHHAVNNMLGVQYGHNFLKYV